MLTSKLISNISVDCVIFGFHDDKLKVLLNQRELFDDITGKLIFSDLTLTGYHVYENEDLDNAAHRIVLECAGSEDAYIDQFSTFGATDRLNKEKDILWRSNISNFSNRVITVGYFAIVNSDKITTYPLSAKLNWIAIDEIGELGFDHRLILSKAIDTLKYRVKFEPLAFQFLSERFTLSQLQKIYELVLNTKLDKRNFRKKIAQAKYLIPLNEKQIGVSHKPAQLYIFSKEVYDKVKKETFDFEL